MVERQKVLSFIFGWNQSFSPSQISGTPQAELEPPQNLSSGFVQLNSAVVINTTPQSS